MKRVPAPKQKKHRLVKKKLSQPGFSVSAFVVTYVSLKSRKKVTQTVVYN